jgi:hypothetical protein
VTAKARRDGKSRNADWCNEAAARASPSSAASRANCSAVILPKDRRIIEDVAVAKVTTIVRRFRLK